MEAAIANCLPPGSKAICLISGRWGERWRNLCKAFGVEVVSVTVPYGEPVQPGQLADALAQASRRSGRLRTLSETATGVRNDIAAFGKLVARTPALSCWSMPSAAWARSSAAPTTGTSTSA